MRAVPPPQGCTTASHEHDACGVAFVATLTGVASHDIVEQALTALRNLDHRGASGAEPDSGDGAGILIQVPDAFLRAVCDFELPAAGSYAVGHRVPARRRRRGRREGRGHDRATSPPRRACGSSAGATCRPTPELLGRDRPRLHAGVRPAVRRRRARPGARAMALERMAFCLRKRAEHETGVYFPSLSSRTLVYKGMLTTDQLDTFFPDLGDERVASAMAVVHSRFSTNTFPSWPLAHPYRFIAHNGEINTVKGNRNWMRAREALLASDLIPGDLEPALSRSARPARRTRRRSTRCSSCSTWAAGRCRTRC